MSFLLCDRKVLSLWQSTSLCYPVEACLLVLAKDKIITVQGPFSLDLLVCIGHKTRELGFNTTLQNCFCRVSVQSWGMQVCGWALSGWGRKGRQWTNKVTVCSQLLWICLTSMLVPFGNRIVHLCDGNSQLWERFHKPSYSNGVILMFTDNAPLTNL